MRRFQRTNATRASIPARRSPEVGVSGTVAGAVAAIIPRSTFPLLDEKSRKGSAALRFPGTKVMKSLEPVIVNAFAAQGPDPVTPGVAHAVTCHCSESFFRHHS
jgi:hypothetical protein